MNGGADLHFHSDGVQPSEVERRVPQEDIERTSGRVAFPQRLPVYAHMHRSDWSLGEGQDSGETQGKGIGEIRLTIRNKTLPPDEKGLKATGLFRNLKIFKDLKNCNSFGGRRSYPFHGFLINSGSNSPVKQLGK